MHRFAGLAVAMVVFALTAKPAGADTTPQLSSGPAPSATPTIAPAAALPDPCSNISAYVSRPSVSSSVCAVKSGQVVLETGYSSTTTTGAGANSTTNVPQSFVHIGIGPRIEIDLTPPSVEVMNNGTTRTSGTSDIGLGFKALLGYSSRALYGFGGSMTMPTGNAAFTNGADTYELIFNGAYTLTSQLSFFGTAGFASLYGTDANGKPVRFGSFVPSAGAAYSLPSNWYVYVEDANLGKASPNAGSRGLVDYGMQKVCGRVQFDAEVGNALNVVNGSRFHYVGFGVSALFGKN
jgi:hypothetical protein